MNIKNIRDHEFVGKIVNSDDPMNLFRCKINVIGIFDGISDDMLPWMFPSATSVFGGTGAGSGSYPKVGTWVKVKFPHNDVYSGEYMGIPNMQPELNSELEGDIINSHIIVYDVDESFKILYTKLQGVIIKLGDNFVNIKKENGEIHLSSETKIFIDTPEITTREGHLVKYKEMKDMFDKHIHMGNLGAPTGIPLPPETVSLHETLPTTLMTKNLVK